MNGYKVKEIAQYAKSKTLHCEGIYAIQENEIEKVVTKEQMESISYKVTKM